MSVLTSVSMNSGHTTYIHILCNTSRPFEAEMSRRGSADAFPQRLLGCLQPFVNLVSTVTAVVDKV